jgi:hypothetical protein
MTVHVDMVTVAHALVRAASRLVSTPLESSTAIAISVDAAGVGACATNCIIMLQLRQAATRSEKVFRAYFLAAHGAAPQLRIDNFPIRVGRGHELPKTLSAASNQRVPKPVK